MKLCKYNCIPCCDFCIYATHEELEYKEKIIKGGPDGCILHKDQQIGYCLDFHCFRADEEDKNKNLD